MIAENTKFKIKNKTRIDSYFSYHNIYISIYYRALQIMTASKNSGKKKPDSLYKIVYRISWNIEGHLISQKSEIESARRRTQQFTL